MKFEAFIAGRYLVAKKSHNVINIISAISATGMAIGTAALIIILSVYNGFDDLVRSMMSNVEPDLAVTPSKGKVFVPEGEAYDWLYDCENVATICTVLEEEVFISYEGRQGIARVKGVDEIYEEETPVREMIRSGSFSLHRGDISQCCCGCGLASSMGINPRFLSPVEIYYPRRTGNLSISDPLSSLNSIKVYPAGTFAISADIDNELMFIQIDKMRELLAYEGNEVSTVEIRLKDNSPKATASIKSGLQERLGEGFKVKDRFEQNESLYKMMKYEKAAIYLILIFVIIIVAFNIFSCLSMLVIEKRDDIGTLSALGAPDGMIKRIFVLEGWFISLSGLVAGLAAGIAFSLLQQKFGFIPMPGSFVVKSYPIILSAKDIIIASIGVAGIGYLISLLSATAFRKERNEN